MTDPIEDKLWADAYAAAFALWCSASKPMLGGSGGVSQHEATAAHEAARAAGMAVQQYRANKVVRGETEPHAMCVCGHTRALHDKYPEYRGGCPECHEHYIRGRATGSCHVFRSVVDSGGDRG